jgi:hypothetical protein
MGNKKTRGNVAKPAKQKATTGDTEDGTTFNNVDISILRKMKADAFIGYRVMRMCPPPPGAFWGKFNDRPVDDEWMKKLAADFEKELDNCSESTAMDVVVDKRWLEGIEEGESEVKILEGKNLSEVPALKFTSAWEENVQEEDLWVMGGNHRQLALNIFLEKTRGDLSKTEAELARISDSNNRASLFHGESVDEENKLKAEVKKKKDAVKSAQKWLVRVYDRGAQTFSLF